ncbi:hypothetical protein V1517DRAFT_329958 [Lipomyces orientalis]|uniref:Uncharacterized protein n=1 Tax=Lipomyces orientalis TaxID=1233043 RepID=A0ACC3TGE3_9ASCO
MSSRPTNEIATRPRKTAAHAEKGDCGYNMVDDDESIVLDCRVKMFCARTWRREGCALPGCEHRQKCRPRWEVGRCEWRGRTSTVKIERETAQVSMYCFNCSVLNVVIQRGDQYRFVAERDELVHHDEFQGPSRAYIITFHYCGCGILLHHLALALLSPISPNRDYIVAGTVPKGEQLLNEHKVARHLKSLSR